MDWLEQLWGSGGEGIAIEVPHLASAVLGIGAILLFAFLILFALKRALRAATEKGKVDETASSFVAAVVRYGVAAVAGVAILGQLGVDTVSLLGSLGIVGLTIGFAARDALSNVISGLFILWDRPFTVGDLIEIDDKYGRVERITMRSTRIITPDGKMLAIPNATVVNTTVASYTNFPNLRLDIAVTVGVEEDLSRARRLLLDLVDEREGYLDTPAPRVVTRAINDYNVEIELQAWIGNERRHIAERYALREAVFETLRGAGVHLPYETIELARGGAASPE